MPETLHRRPTIFDTNHRRTTLLPRILATLAIVLLAACAAAPDKTAVPAAPPVAAPPDAALRARVTAYYAALIAGHYQEAYEFFTPGYRSTWSVQAHYQIHPPIGAYLSAEVTAVNCISETVCDVAVSTRYRFDKTEEWIGSQELPMDMKSRWLNIDGQWYFVPRV